VVVAAAAAAVVVVVVVTFGRFWDLLVLMLTLVSALVLGLDLGFQYARESF